MNFRKLAEKYRDSYFKDLNTLVEIESTKDEAKADPAAGMPFGQDLAKLSIHFSKWPIAMGLKPKTLMVTLER